MTKKKTRISQFLQNVKVSDWELIRDEILEKVSRVTFSNWKNGVYDADSKYWSAINAIAEKYGYPKPYTV